MFGKDVQRHKQVFNMEELTESSDEGELGFEEAPAGERGDQLDEFLEENYEEVEDEYEDIEVPLNPPGTLDPAQIGLPPAPIFNHFEHLAPAHQRQIHLPIAFRTAGIAREGGDGVLLREEDADVSPNGVLFTGRSSQLDRNQIVEHGPGVQGVCWDTPGRFFKLFFTEETFKQLADNTNAYANSKRAGHHNGSGRQWKTVETAELKIFIGLIIYMGVFKSARIHDYWRTDGEFPIPCIVCFIGQNRFEQLKRYFHISLPALIPRKQWAQKMEPLSTILEHKFQEYCTPTTPVSIDEMMVRFTGRSVHKIRLKSKPIPEGFKIIALCEKGYTYAFLYTSRVDSFTGLNAPRTYQFPALNNSNNQEEITLRPTSRAVVQLCLTLPYRTKRFVLYCDNYFSNIPLFQILRLYGISACGTARPTSVEYPRELKINKKNFKLPWNTISGIVKNSILAIIWQDRTLVRFLTTAFGATPNDARNIEMRERCRPRVTDTNRDLVEEGWPIGPDGQVPIHRLQPLPIASVRYNYHMGGVDIADQRRSYYAIQFRIARYWLALFFWLLDVTLINSHLIAQEVFPRAKFEIIRDHRAFRVRVAWNMVLEGAQELNRVWSESLCQQRAPNPTGRNCPGVAPTGNTHQSRSHGYVTKNYCFPLFRLSPGDHTLTRSSKPKPPYPCVFCRYLRLHHESDRDSELFERWKITHPREVVQRTIYECAFCKESLCKEFCFREFPFISLATVFYIYYSACAPAPVPI